MEVILLTSFLIEFLVRHAFVDSVTTTTTSITTTNTTNLERKKHRIKPNYGYEPYWPESDWVFSKHVTTARGRPANCTPVMCYRMYQKFAVVEDFAHVKWFLLPTENVMPLFELVFRFGQICARNVNFTHRTFDNYCEMQNADCSEEKTIKWMIAYRGKCTELKTFPTQMKFLATRAEEHLKKFNDSLTSYKHIQDYHDEYVKDKKKIEYNPTYGYEPYWYNGDWVFQDLKPEPNGTTTPQPKLVCGDECPYIYRKVQHVCSRNVEWLIFDGCSPSFWFGGCVGNRIDDLTRGFKTFDTYCEFLDAQCRSPPRFKYMFLHRGKCIRDVNLYLKPISVYRQLLSRITHYYTQLSNARDNHSLPPINFT